MEDDQNKRLEEKLDQILVLLHGDGKGELGLAQKVNLLWIVVMRWPLYIVTTGLGVVITLVIQHVANLKP